jgi:hypothetical protein
LFRSLVGCILGGIRTKKVMMVERGANITMEYGLLLRIEDHESV